MCCAIRTLTEVRLDALICTLVVLLDAPSPAVADEHVRTALDSELDKAEVAPPRRLVEETGARALVERVQVESLGAGLVEEVEHVGAFLDGGKGARHVAGEEDQVSRLEGGARVCAALVAAQTIRGSGRSSLTFDQSDDLWIGGALEGSAALVVTDRVVNAWVVEEELDDLRTANVAGDVKGGGR